MSAVIFRLWRLSTASSLVSWLATKTFISALYMNDTMLVTGDNIPIYITQTPGPLLFVLDEAPLQHKILHFGLFGCESSPISRNVRSSVSQ